MLMTDDSTDPDLNLQSVNDHGIFTVDELNELSFVVKPHLSAFHLNVRSLNRHFSELIELLASIPFAFDFMAFSETWFTSETNIEELEILGYNMVSDDRTYSSGGGVALCLRDGNDFQMREDLRIDGIENLWVDTGERIVGVIYNPPNHFLGEFLDNIENALHSIYLSKKKCLILGDININTLVKNFKSRKYLNLIYSEGFSPLIFEATRITENSISCIDHIHSNFISYSTSGSIAYKVADHLPVFAVVYDPKHQPFPNTIEYRDFRKFQRQAFRNDLRKEIWTSVFKSSDPNESLSRFLHLFNNISNKHAPLKMLKTKNKPNKPWVTIGLKKSIQMRDKLYKQWLLPRDVSFYDRYKTYRLCNRKRFPCLHSLI